MKKKGIFKRTEEAFIQKILFLVAKFYLKKPDTASLLYIKYRSFKQLWKGFVNELFYILGFPYGAYLNSCNIEITNLCNLKCKMCPVNNGMRREQKHMEFSLFKAIIDKNPTLDFILPFQWGEPLLNKDFLKMVEYAVSKGMRVMFTTNGTLLNEAMSRKVIESGAERITFSVDGFADTHTNIRGFDYDKLKNNIKRFREIRDELDGDIKIDISMVVFEDTEADADKYFSEWEQIADRVQLIPRFISGKREKKCRELWRGVLVVLVDGRVSICCVDHEGVAIVGDATKQSLKEIWNGKEMRKYRTLHVKKKFPEICKECNEYESSLVSKRFT